MTIDTGISILRRDWKSQFSQNKHGRSRLSRAARIQMNDKVQSPNDVIPFDEAKTDSSGSPLPGQQQNLNSSKDDTARVCRDTNTKKQSYLDLYSQRLRQESGKASESQNLTTSSQPKSPFQNLTRPRKSANKMMLDPSRHCNIKKKEDASPCIRARVSQPLTSKQRQHSRGNAKTLDSKASPVPPLNTYLSSQAKTIVQTKEEIEEEEIIFFDPELVEICDQSSQERDKVNILGLDGDSGRDDNKEQESKELVLPLHRFVAEQAPKSKSASIPVVPGVVPGDQYMNRGDLLSIEESLTETSETLVPQFTREPSLPPVSKPIATKESHLPVWRKKLLLHRLNARKRFLEHNAKTPETTCRVEKNKKEKKRVRIVTPTVSAKNSTVNIDVDNHDDVCQILFQPATEDEDDSYHSLLDQNETFPWQIGIPFLLCDGDDDKEIDDKSTTSSITSKTSTCASSNVSSNMSSSEDSEEGKESNVYSQDETFDTTTISSLSNTWKEPTSARMMLSQVSSSFCSIFPQAMIASSSSWGDCVDRWFLVPGCM